MRSTRLPPQIGGLDAELFVGRRVKVQFGNIDPNPSIVRVIALTNKGKVRVKHQGMNNTTEVDPKCVHPWWSENPDLKKKLDALNDEPEAVSQPIVNQRLERALAYSPPEPPIKPATPEPIPTNGFQIIPPAVQVTPKTNGHTPVALRRLKGFSASVDVSDDWIEIYQSLKKTMAGFENKRLLMERLQREMAEETAMVELWAEELERKGVTVQWE